MFNSSSKYIFINDVERNIGTVDIKYIPNIKTIHFIHEYNEFKYNLIRSIVESGINIYEYKIEDDDGFTFMKVCLNGELIWESDSNSLEYQ